MRLIPKLLAATFSALLLVASPSMAQDLQVKQWASACANCHGTNGRAEGTAVSLAGQPADELIKKMVAFKSGERQATIMHQIAKGYTDEQLAQLADYFAAQR